MPPITAAERAPGIHEITSWVCSIKEQFGCIKRASWLLLSHIRVRVRKSCQKQSTQTLLCHPCTCHSSGLSLLPLPGLGDVLSIPGSRGSAMSCEGMNDPLWVPGRSPGPIHKPQHRVKKKSNKSGRARRGARKGARRRKDPTDSLWDQAAGEENIPMFPEAGRDAHMCTTQAKPAAPAGQQGRN